MLSEWLTYYAYTYIPVCTVRPHLHVHTYIRHTCADQNELGGTVYTWPSNEGSGALVG